MVKNSKGSSTPVIMLKSPHYTGYTEAVNYIIWLKYLCYSISYDLGTAYNERTVLLFNNEDIDEKDERFIELLKKTIHIYVLQTEKNENLNDIIFDFLFYSNPLDKEYLLQPADCHTVLLVMDDFPMEGEEYDFGVIPLKYFDPDMSLSANGIRMILQDCAVMDEPLILRVGEVPSDVYEQEPEPEGSLYS